MRFVLFALALTGCSGPSEPAAPPINVEVAGTSTPHCARSTPKRAIPPTCNGAAELCDRTYNRVTVAMTHNAMSNAAEGFTVPNQNNPVAKQLADGVRGLMLDTHYFDAKSGATDKRVEGVPAVDQAFLCHVSCGGVGNKPMVDTLCDITNFLDQNRGEVVSIIFESNVTPADTEAVMREAGLTDYVYTHTGSFPTLRDMIATNKRLVVFTESNGGDPAWYHEAWSLIYDTPYRFFSTSEFTCALNRGSKNNPLFLMNHWVSTPLSSPENATAANAESVLLTRAQQCTTETGKVPNFIGVDFYDIGAVLNVARKMNGLP